MEDVVSKPEYLSKQKISKISPEMRDVDTKSKSNRKNDKNDKNVDKKIDNNKQQ